MAELQAVARSPIAVSTPRIISGGWEVSARRSFADLRLADWTPCAKVLVRGTPEDFDRVLALPRFGSSVVDYSGRIVAATGIDEWTIVGAPGSAPSIIAEFSAEPAADLITIRDATHAFAMLRLVGGESASVLAKLCAVDLRAGVFSNGSVIRSSIARVAATVIRHDIQENQPEHADGTAAKRQSQLSYLILCDRTAGQYLFDVTSDAGSEYSIDIDGFVYVN